MSLKKRAQKGKVRVIYEIMKLDVLILSSCVEISSLVLIN